MNVLFISNGHGEDAVAAYIVRELRRRLPEIGLGALPLIGNGGAYRAAGVEVHLPPAVLSHGFSQWRALSAAVRLILAIPGYPALQSAGMIAAVGDAYPLLCALRLKRPCIFAGVNKSEYYTHSGHRYLPWERALMKRALLTFTRDAKTAGQLQAKGVRNVRYAGNPMMDLPASSPVRRSGRTIVLLPGSYEDMALNMADLLRAAAACGHTGSGIQHFVMAVPAEASDEMIASVESPGWEAGRDGWRRGEMRVELSRNLSGEIAACELVIGLSGTANEQAAGLGRPVIGFPGRGVQYTRAFMSEQHDLLGDALAEASGPSGAALTAAAILGDRTMYDRMAAAGRERMGGPGGSAAIAAAIADALGHQAVS